MRIRPQFGRAAARGLVTIATASAVSGAALPIAQDMDDESDSSWSSTVHATAMVTSTGSTPSGSHIPSRTSALPPSPTVGEASSPTTSHKSHANKITGKVIAAICIPLLFLVFLCWICSPIGPEGKRRRRRRENLARLQVSLRQRDQAAAATLRATNAAAAAARPLDENTAAPEVGQQQDQTQPSRTRQVFYLYTGIGPQQREQLPAYNQAPAANEVLLAQGSQQALTDPAADPLPTPTSVTPSEIGSASSPRSSYPPARLSISTTPDISSSSAGTSPAGPAPQWRPGTTPSTARVGALPPSYESRAHGHL